MEYILGRFGVDINAGLCASGVGVVPGAVGGGKPQVHYPCICFTPKSKSSFLAKRDLVFILWIVLILLSELRDISESLVV